MDNTINVTGMQGDRELLRAAIPNTVEQLPHNWPVQTVRDMIAELRQGRSNKAKRAAIALLEYKLGLWERMTRAPEPFGYGAGERDKETDRKPHIYRGYADGSSCYICGQIRNAAIHPAIDTLSTKRVGPMTKIQRDRCYQHNKLYAAYYKTALYFVNSLRSSFPMYHLATAEELRGIQVLHHVAIYLKTGNRATRKQRLPWILQ